MSDQTQSGATKEIRPYQKDALISLSEAFVKKANVKRGLLVLPTGSGKTFVATFFANQLNIQLGLKIIWCAHREELIKQAKESFLSVNENLKISEWTSKTKDCSGDIILVSIGSSKGLAETIEVLSGAGSQKYVLIIDEAHHFAESDAKGYSNMYGKLEKALWDSKLLKFSLGLTATATRLDQKPLGYDEIVYQLPFIEGVKEGFVARPVTYEMRTKQQFHLDEATKANGKRDYTDQDLKRLDNSQRNESIANYYVRNAEYMHDADGNLLYKDGNPIPGWGKTIIFAVNVPHCYHLAEKILDLDPKADIRVITGSSTDEERKEFSEWLAEGDMHTPKVAINCLVFTEGFDEPTINTVFLTRPTKSEALWMQMVGRGARIIKDENGNIIKSKFNLVSIMDEIGRYGALVKEWSIALMDPNALETKKAAANHKAKIRAKRKLVTKFLEDFEVNMPSLDEGQLIDVQAVLIVSTKVTAPLGLPMDRDRLDCIRLLKDYVSTCYQQVEFSNGLISEELDMEAFKNSYSYCVQANEFDHNTWRQIALAYFFYYIKGNSRVRNTYTGKMESTWLLYPLVDKLEIEGEQAVKEAEERIKDVKETAISKNDEYNARWSSRNASKELYLHILENIVKRGMPDAVTFINANVIRVISKNRKLEVKIRYQVTGRKDPNLRLIGGASKIGTDIMQQYLQDSVCEFKVSPTTRE